MMYYTVMINGERKKTELSARTEVLFLLEEYGKKIDSSTITENDFIALQKMSARIIQLHSDGQLNGRQYRALHDICADLIDAARDALRR